MLTRKQYDLLAFIHQRMQRDGVSPSFDEMKEALDLRSKSGIHRLITALEERGFIRRLPHRARAIEVLRLPENIAERPRRGFTPSVIEGGERGAREPRPETRPEGRAELRPAPEARFGPAPEARFGPEAGTRDVPLLGRIAAGVPIEAIQQGDRSVGVPAAMLGRGAEHFALEVRGDSMTGAGILDGDLVVIRRQISANVGDIVVALVDDAEATLKRLKRADGGRIALEAANPAYETRILGIDQVKIQGRLVGLVRTY